MNLFKRLCHQDAAVLDTFCALVSFFSFFSFFFLVCFFPLWFCEVRDSAERKLNRGQKENDGGGARDCLLPSAPLFFFVLGSALARL